MTQFSNSFNQSPEKGQINLLEARDVTNVQIASDQAGTLGPAMAVKLKDVAGPQIVVEKVTDVINDTFFGFIPYEVRTNEHTALAQVKAVGNGEVMLMEASAAIARGAQVEYNLTGDKVTTKTTGATIGVALDKAAADGDLIRVKIVRMGL